MRYLVCLPFSMDGAAVAKSPIFSYVAYLLPFLALLRPFRDHFASRLRGTKHRWTARIELHAATSIQNNIVQTLLEKLGTIVRVAPAVHILASERRVLGSEK